MSLQTASIDATMDVAALAKAIDHALLQPSQTDLAFEHGCAVACQWKVGALCVKSCDVQRARARLEIEGGRVAICAVVGFPHANAPTELICLEARRAIEQGATEIDAVLNLSRVLSNDWDAVTRQIESFHHAVVQNGGILKVIFETGLIAETAQKVRLCEICRSVGVAYVKTSTGFAIGKRTDGTVGALGATLDDVRLLARHASPCKVKASGGIRTFAEATALLKAGAQRIGTASTEQILTEARKS